MVRVSVSYFPWSLVIGVFFSRVSGIGLVLEDFFVASGEVGWASGSGRWVKHGCRRHNLSRLGAESVAGAHPPEGPGGFGTNVLDMPWLLGSMVARVAQGG